MTGFESKRQAAQAKVQEEMQAVFTKRQAERDKLQDEPDMLLIVYQRGFADGKAAQPEQEPTCPKCKAAVLYECVACSSNNYPHAAPSEWPLIKNILAEYGLDAIAFVAEWIAAQRPWIGLTHDQTKDCIKAWDGNDAYVLCRAIEDKLKERNT